MSCYYCGGGSGFDRHDFADQDAVETLAAAITRGDMRGASEALDLAFRNNAGMREWIARGRRSRAARRAPSFHPAGDLPGLNPENRA